ncbi:MAG TPA: poly(R)-hydroxyalkanoic acid synthase subunit PhaE [Bacteroidia bacterium]|nr:poly(R)-hydroxyalkanoic acid synthase subunit PhaE [Bacteroidia bacterium]
MKNTKNLMDAMVESSSKAVNNWVETAQKAQKAALSGTSLEKNSELYKEWLNNQMSIFRNITLNDDDQKEGTHTAENANTNVEDFYKNWYNNQMAAFKQMTDFNQNLLNAWSNFGKPANEINANFSSINQAWTSIYENWMNTMNNTYNNLSNTMKGGLNKNVFEQMFQSQNVMLKMQEFYAPFQKAMQTGQFNMETFKKMMDPAEYKKNMENMFTSMMPQNNMKEFFEMYAKQMHTMFGNSQNLTNEFKESMDNMMKSFPQLFNADMGKMMNMYNQMSDNLQKTVAPFVKMMAPGKEKERIEASFETLDKIAIYHIKNAQLQYLMMTTGQKAVESTMEMVIEKFKNQTEITSFNKFFQEWVNLNEGAFIELFNSDDFSALKAEVTSLSLAIKKDLETQFESQMAVYPFVFKSDMNEIYQNIHDLKNKVKSLEAQLAAVKASTVELEEEEVTKKSTSRKK